MGTFCSCGAPGGSDYNNITVELRVRGSTSAKEYAKKSFAMESKEAGGAQGASINFMGKGIEARGGDGAMQGVGLGVGPRRGWV
jgi:hypothetical protein